LDVVMAFSCVAVMMCDVFAARREDDDGRWEPPIMRGHAQIEAWGE
jgi:hypothetical protein